MPILLFLGLAALIAAAGAAFSGARLARSCDRALKKTLVTRVPKAPTASKAIGALVVVAQLTELVKLIEHANLATFAGALMLLVILVAGKNRGENHTGL
jgi:hypothetical protein